MATLFSYLFIYFFFTRKRDQLTPKGRSLRTFIQTFVSTRNRFSITYLIKLSPYLIAPLLNTKILTKSQVKIRNECLGKTYGNFHFLFSFFFFYMVSACHKIKNVRVSQNQFCSQSSNIWDLLLLYFIITQAKLTPVSKCWGLLALKYTSFVIYWPMYGQKHPWKRSNFQ